MTYMSISEVLAQTCWSNATTAKIWPLRNFCQFFPRQKLEVNKIGSSATRPLFTNKQSMLLKVANKSRLLRDLRKLNSTFILRNKSSFSVPCSSVQHLFTTRKVKLFLYDPVGQRLLLSLSLSFFLSLNGSYFKTNEPMFDEWWST